MLKTLRQGQMWLVTQPDHAQVSGYLAAHWGNDDFARPGYFASSPDSERDFGPKRFLASLNTTTAGGNGKPPLNLRT